LMLVLRARMIWQFSGFVAIQSARIGDIRESRYWLDVAGAAPAAKEVRLFGIQEWTINRQFTAAARARHPVWEGTDRFVRRQRIPLLLVAAGYMVPFLVLADQAATGTLRAGTVAFAATALLAVASLGMLSGDQWAIEAAMASTDAMKRVEGLLPASRGAGGGGAVSVPHAEPAQGSDLRPPAIGLEAVHFAYPGGNPVLDGLDLQIEAGRSLAIVGANGAGKTTLVKLLTRLYEPTSGRITVDGTPLPDVPASEWRSRISVIFQDFVHYELSASDNVGLAELGSSRSDWLQEGAALAGAADLIEGLPKQWMTVLSRSHQGGTELSGGEWQRIALARLLYGVAAGRDLIILDEPTANLSAEGEIEIFNRLVAAAGGRTVILVSHRFSTVRRADAIAVLAEGRIAELGTHAELLEAGGRYSAMFHAQADRYAVESAPQVDP